MRKWLLFLSLTVMTGAASGGSASADGLRLEPSVACDLLADQGLRTRGGYRASGEAHHCRSQRRALSGGGQPNNTLRFSARGTVDEVCQLTLELQVNSLTSVQRAHRQLADRARLLFERALNAPWSDEIEGAILSAVQGEWTFTDFNVRLDRITVGVPRYELRLVIDTIASGAGRAPRACDGER